MVEDAPTMRRPRAGVILLALLAALAVALLVLWVARKPIATDLIDRELARRGVPARYQVKRIGLRTQRLEGLVIGDPRAPDLTARWVEIDVRPTLGAPELRAIRAGGVRLRGRLVGGRLTMGAVDRLLGPPGEQPFRLPDLVVGLDDARMALATPAGAVTLRIDGKGNLADGFAGRYVAIAPALAQAGCRLGAARLAGTVSTDGGRPRFAGPIAAEQVNCADAELAGLSGAIDATLQPGLDGWRGQAKLASRHVRASGWTAAGLRGQVDFAGNAARTRGTARVGALGIAAPPGSMPRVDTLASGVAGTPFAPIAAAFARIAAVAGRSSDADARLSLTIRGGAGALTVTSAGLTGGGARIAFAGGQGIGLAWPGSGRPRIDGRVTMTGPGIPRIVADLRQAAPGAPISGVARMDPHVAGGSRVAFAPVRFADGRFTSRVEASGPLFGGRVEQASLPLVGRIGAGGLALNPGCAPLAFRRFSVSGLVMEPASLRLCPTGAALLANGRAAGTIDAPRLRGTLGSSPVTLAAGRLRFVGADFHVTDLAARLGGTDRISRLDIAALSGAPGRGLAGTFSGASGQIGNVPLIVSGGAGRWRFSQGVLDVAGGLTVADEPDPPRFNPLVARDFTLRIEGRALTARADLREPATGVIVTQVALRHDLSAGTGNADLDVAALRFDRALQPEKLTRLTLGVVADLDATLTGKGSIAWTPAGVTSDGRFRFDAAALSAPFGPVTGVAGELRFTDLLNMVTAPGQQLTVATVNPGILVADGVVTYQIVPGLKLAVESARWPFAGGALTLRPTVLDFSEEAARNLTFDIDGVDAAKFINQLEFANVSATGTFDGTLPMVFDRDGGRIVGGSIASRAPGGTLSYVGQVSNADLGIWGGIAFDALKAIQYQNMTIALDGRVDGEMVSQIRFNGVSRGTIKPVATGLIARIGGQLATQVQRLPFIFNIRITGPFRGLISMARSFSDPGMLIADQLGPGYVAAPRPAVQPPASEDKP